ncbi:inosine-uridine preferring nucleoside hydrolase [Ceratobasidium sp. AG-Ba]|nr:inosine-uridine preferring nucleoside hydrolase [Ceratobasidium sp. AG-Ba]QRW01938.1 inosine-uridine preferring nucleoside hydrolase [Ceratobasidium sp. AG-Ba]
MADDSQKTKYLWLDCDPGHDDAIAILMALYTPGIKLLGISTVHGNNTSANTFANAIKLLYAYGASDKIRVYPGASQPLIRPARADPEIHGPDGLGGVVGLPGLSHPAVASLYTQSQSLRAVQGLEATVKSCIERNIKLHIIASGPLTNIALFSALHPELVSGIEQIIFMGGGVGVGNRSAVAEFNILCDPEAAQMVLNLEVPKVMIPLNVTHTAILTRELHDNGLVKSSATTSDTPTALRVMLSSLVRFFAETYRTTFGFTDGPPIHDACCVAYLHNPEWFKVKRYRVDIELAGTHSAGETVVDVWGYLPTENSWGRAGKNCMITESMDVPSFFNLFFECVSRCDQVSPLNS